MAGSVAGADRRHRSDPAGFPGGRRGGVLVGAFLPVAGDGEA
ncbi:hypothetical protein [Pseudonocardia acidicola]|nr:hypothetical protein [Pseudonocardia acidicola]